jgi:hypothetical protein
VLLLGVIVTPRMGVLGVIVTPGLLLLLLLLNLMWAGETGRTSPVSKLALVVPATAADAVAVAAAECVPLSASCASLL